jgi:hypothetical protein
MLSPSLRLFTTRLTTTRFMTTRLPISISAQQQQQQQQQQQPPSSHHPFSTTSKTLLPENANANDQDPDADSDNPMPDGLATRSAKGHTGGDEALDSISRNAPAKPKISNLSVPGGPEEAAKNMTDAQRKEVEEHNKDFERKHDRGEKAPRDKVDKNFWKG